MKPGNIILIVIFLIGICCNADENKSNNKPPEDIQNYLSGLWLEKNFYSTLINTKSFMRALEAGKTPYLFLSFGYANNKFTRCYGNFHDNGDDTLLTMEQTGNKIFVTADKVLERNGFDYFIVYPDSITWVNKFDDSKRTNHYVKVYSSNKIDFDSILRYVISHTLAGSYLDSKGKEYIFQKDFNVTWNGKQYKYNYNWCPRDSGNKEDSLACTDDSFFLEKSPKNRTRYFFVIRNDSLIMNKKPFPIDDNLKQLLKRKDNLVLMKKKA